MQSPDLEVNVLMSIEDVTAKKVGGGQGRQNGRGAIRRGRAAKADIERESLQKTGLRSDVVTLYQGGEYWLYRYKKYTDVRLVFAPEQQTAFFGGDPGQFHLSALRPRHGAVPRLRERRPSIAGIT